MQCIDFLFYIFLFNKYCDIYIDYMTHWITERTSYLTPYFHSWPMLQFILKKTARGMLNHMRQIPSLLITLLKIPRWLPISTTVKSKFLTMPTRPWNTFPTLIPSVSDSTSQSSPYPTVNTMAPYLFLKHIRHASASGPLCLPILQPRMFLPRYEPWFSHLLLYSWYPLQKCNIPNILCLLWQLYFFLHKSPT